VLTDKTLGWPSCMLLFAGLSAPWRQPGGQFFA